MIIKNARKLSVLNFGGQKRETLAERTGYNSLRTGDRKTRIAVMSDVTFGNLSFVLRVSLNVLECNMQSVFRVGGG